MLELTDLVECEALFNLCTQSFAIFVGWVI